MADTTQTFIDSLITDIWNAEDPESVTNGMVARVFDYLNKGYKDLLTNNSAVATEKSEREAADAALQRTIDTIQLAILSVKKIADEAQTATASNRESINAILGKNASQAIENFNEILAFLEGVKDSDSLVTRFDEILKRLDSSDAKGKQLRDEFDSLCELFDENDGKTEVAFFRSKETAILPFDGITYNIGQNQHPGIHYFAPGKQFILRTSDSQYYKDLDYKISDYNEVDSEGRVTAARSDRIFRLGSVLYRFDGLRLVKIGESEDLPFSFNKESALPQIDWQSRYFYYGDDRGDYCEEPYNTFDSDGNPVANPARIFRCGQQRYRHTGRQLVNIGIEQNPHVRVVPRCPSLDAHPGLVYRNTGRIRIKASQGVAVFSLDKMFVEQDDGHRIPLDSCPVVEGLCHSYKDNEVVPEPDDNGVCTVTLPSTARPLYVHIMHIVQKNGIACRYDASGNKIFYGVSCEPIKRKLAAPTLLQFRPVIKSISYKSSQHRGVLDMKANFRRKYEIQIWSANKHTIATDSDDVYNRMTIAKQYRWRRFNRMSKIPRSIDRTALIRVRRVKLNDKSEWAYFHINFTAGTIKPAKART